MKKERWIDRNRVRFDGMSWPSLDCARDLSGQLRYADQDQSLCLGAAAVVDAYLDLIETTPQKRRHVVSQIRQHDKRAKEAP